MKRIAATLVLLALPVASVFAADAAAGKAVFEKSCKSCHGVDGTGNPAVAKMMKVEMKPLGSVSTAEVKETVTKGHGKMKPVASVSGAALDDVAAYVATLKK